MPEIDCSHPYWGQSIQCRERQAKQQQQKPQAKPEAKPQQKAQEKPREGKSKKPRDSFDDELLNRHVKIVMLANGNAEEISGTIIEASRYWLKVLDDNGTLRYINKAFIITITPQ